MIVNIVILNVNIVDIVNIVIVILIGIPKWCHLVVVGLEVSEKVALRLVRAWQLWIGIVDIMMIRMGVGGDNINQSQNIGKIIIRKEKGMVGRC